MASIATLKRMSAAQLSDLILAGTPKLVIVDVRDDDYIGGHIKGSMHVPSGTLDAMLPTLVRKLRDADTVVFHCALSQQRGPGAALRYLREMERLTTPTATAASGPTAGEGAGSVPPPPQTVYVLDRGFVGWQELHGEDERLTEGFRRELWRNY